MWLGKICLSHGILMILLASGGADIGNNEGAREGRPVVTVSGYCEEFARQYSEDNAIGYQEGSARVEKKSDIMRGLSNLFQPSDSRFTADTLAASGRGSKGNRLKTIP